MAVEYKPYTDAQMQVAATLTSGLISALDLSRHATPLIIANTELPSQAVILYRKVLEELAK